jgi:hypothetical protein
VALGSEEGNKEWVRVKRNKKSKVTLERKEYTKKGRHKEIQNGRGSEIKYNKE